MDMKDPYDFKSLQELLDKNKNVIESFFGKSIFDSGFVKKAMSQLNDENQQAHINTETRVSTSQPKIPVDIIQRNHEMFIAFEIPGLKDKDDVKIKAFGSNLIVEGEIKRNYSYSREDQTKYERSVGSFIKKVPIPIVYDSKRIRARYVNGLLEVRIPVLRQNNHENISVFFPED